MFPFEGDLAITNAIYGPSGIGKTQYAILYFRYHKEMFPDQKITTFIVCYNEWQSAYAEIRKYCPKVEFIQGLIGRAKLDTLGKDNTYSLIFIDDLMQSISDSSLFAESIISMSHHRRLNIIFTLHNIFYQGKYTRTLTLNTKYITLFVSRRDQTQVTRLGNQILGTGGGRALIECFKDLLSTEKYPYIFIDMSPHIDPVYTLRSKIFPDQETVVYVMKGGLY